ncbi:DUF4269 domain-containing protein [Ancylomarina sp. 16SWW S1-10-2]|uniref:DUF4269 domain-containing protein n=1 Tax=Ancylomarina sp. 16SWW S1-10-2 TaxID=2499681 RepID=UPI0012AE33B7|nr:DUF4269 domain-containing protein [Ancylomarina sp. 16SWW S1-10-2]MRT92909.1 DUF4269 domain-containing protein [Ancylomarina sp. 16SWW S1-10-2]
MNTHTSFEKIDYLRNGNEKQQRAYELLTKHKVLEKLRQFDPILVGTIPINIDIESSDLDVICYCENQAYFKKILTAEFGDQIGFRIWETVEQPTQDTFAYFIMDEFEVEIFGQNIHTKDQIAYRHMIIEDRLLNQRGEAFRKRIVDLKHKGYRTEPAFSMELGLKQNHNRSLLELESEIN